MTKTCPDCQATVLSTSQPNRMDTPNDADWKRAVECAFLCLHKVSITRAELDNAMQHAFGILALAATPAVGGEREKSIRASVLSLREALPDAEGIKRWCDSFLLALAAPPASPLRGRESERCPMCRHTDEEYASGDLTCADPWHADDHLRAKVASSPLRGKELHPDTQDLVEKLSWALEDKLLRAQKKYGYGNNWLVDDWKDDCQLQLIEHLEKGDPLDVVAYAAFMWARGWPTASPPEQPAPFQPHENCNCLMCLAEKSR